MAQQFGPVFGTGKDGHLVVSGTQVVNTYTGLTGNHLSGLSSISVDSISGFSNGDLILIHKTRGATTEPGTWELNRISGTPSGGALPLMIPTINPYYESSSDQTQIVRIPEYLSVTVPTSQTLGCTGWNNNLGGIVAFCCSGITNVIGTISAAGKIGQKQTGGTNGDGGGFHGGGGYVEPSPGPGIQGEGQYGVGGASKSSNYEGGGAAQGTSQGGVAGQTDSTFATKLIFGGGGGGGKADRGTAPTGGNGGGIILMFSKILTVTGAITANGGNGYANGSNDWGDGGGGGGGCIFIKSTRVTGANLVTATGGYAGTGGNGGKGAGGAGSANGLNGDAGAPAGDGGAGRIRIEAGSIVGTSNPAHTTLGSLIPWGGSVGIQG